MVRRESTNWHTMIDQNNIYIGLGILPGEGESTYSAHVYFVSFSITDNAKYKRQKQMVAVLLWQKKIRNTYEYHK